MRVRCFPSDFGGCGYTRLRWPAQHLRSQGCDVAVRAELPAIWQRGPLGIRCIGVEKVDFDVAVFQRVFRHDLVVVMDALKKQGVAIVVDVDDDFLALTPKHPVWHDIHPKTTASGKSWVTLREACRLADLVTVSTDALAHRYGQRAVVVRNGIPQAYLGMERTGTHVPPLLGWSGFANMHPGDLEVVSDSVASLCNSGHARFRAIGGRDTASRLGLKAAEHQSPVRLATFDYARAMAELDIGIAPLADTAFNRAKSWLKPLEYAALGVPWVGSASVEYARLQAEGAGSLASRPREWMRELRRLLESADLRLSEAARGRQVAAAHTIEQTMAPQLWQAWSLAYRLRASSSASGSGISKPWSSADQSQRRRMSQATPSTSAARVRNQSRTII